MCRPKLLLTNDFIQLINSDLKEIKDSYFVVKLLAVKARFNHKESEEEGTNNES